MAGGSVDLAMCSVAVISSVGVETLPSWGMRLPWLAACFLLQPGVIPAASEVSVLEASV